MSSNRTVYGNVAADEDGVSESAGARVPPLPQEGGGWRRNIQLVLVLVGFCIVVYDHFMKPAAPAAEASQQPVAFSPAGTVAFTAAAAADSQQAVAFAAPAAAESQQPGAFTAAESQQPAAAPAAAAAVAVTPEAAGAARDLWVPPDVFACTVSSGTALDFFPISSSALVRDLKLPTLTQADVKPVKVTFPGIKEQVTFNFLAHRPSFLSGNSFTTGYFFCPQNGFEGSLTNIWGQILMTQRDQESAVVVDIGSNLGFYSLVSASLGFDVFSFDIQPLCLHLLGEFARQSGLKHRLHSLNIGLSNSAGKFTNHDGGCDVENFFQEAGEGGAADASQVVDAKKRVLPLARYDQIMPRLGSVLQGRKVSLLKIDTEGAEVNVVGGMRDELAKGTIKNVIIEITPAHWFRFGFKDDAAEAWQIFIDLTEKYGYEAYNLWLPSHRRPPAYLKDVIGAVDRHPFLPGEKDTGCKSPFFKIHDMRKFFSEYCIKYLQTVNRFGGKATTKEKSCRGFCGNIWFRLPGAGSSSDAPAGPYIHTNALDNLPMSRLKTEFVGSTYGGWSYVPALLGKDSVVYSVGLGEDVSWDEGTIARHGCKVFGFDPTPKSALFIEKRFAEGHLEPSTFSHTREGLAVEKGNLVFALPKNKAHVSMRAGAGDIGGGTISVPVNTLENWMLANGHQQLDILKIDIEGSEYAVLENWIARGFFPFRQLLVEFHHRFLPAEERHRHADVLEGLKRSGFVVVHDAKGQEISFYNPTIRGSAMESAPLAHVAVESTALGTASSAPDPASGSEGDGKSKNERQYGAQYWQWQSEMNRFGATCKGDLIKHLIPAGTQSILEFGSSGGNIIHGMTMPKKYGIEINPASRAYSLENFPDVQVWERLEQVPSDQKIDVVYTTSVLEHVDCPLCEMRKLVGLLAPGSLMIVGLKNDGADPSQTFERMAHDASHHIYTWNPLLLANMLTSAGLHVCDSVQEFSAWHAISVNTYLADRFGYCQKGLTQGQKLHSASLWATAVLPENRGSCADHKRRVQETLKCSYLKG